MRIKLDNWNIEELSFSIVDEERQKNSFDLNLGHFFPEEAPDSFGVGFIINIKDSSFDLNLKATFMFSVDGQITEEFKLSDFPKVNAPAIAFPYLRAFISNLTLQSGFKPVILPSINFVNLAKEQETDG